MRTTLHALAVTSLAIAAFAALYRWQGKLTVLWVVLGCGLIGGLLQATGAV